jgi:hypothetical protein
MEDIVGMDFSGNSFFADLMSSRGNMLVSDGYGRILAAELPNSAEVGVRG